MKEKKIVLSIAGSDPAGGAGIQADIKTCVKLDVYPCAAIAAVTAQNTSEVSAIFPLETNIVRAQLEAVLSDIRPDAVKLGMLGSVENILAISELIRKFELVNVVIDPVLSTTLGKEAPDSDYLSALVGHLFPLATLVTPNLDEKHILENFAASDIFNMASAVLVKGGHSETKDVTDILYTSTLEHAHNDFQSTAFPSLNSMTQPYLQSDANHFEPNELHSSIKVKEFTHKKINSCNTHGSGCVLSSAIACYLAMDFHIEKAVELGIKFILDAFKSSSLFNPGKGKYGPCLI